MKSHHPMNSLKRPRATVFSNNGHGLWTRDALAGFGKAITAVGGLIANPAYGALRVAAEKVYAVSSFTCTHLDLSLIHI